MATSTYMPNDSIISFTLKQVIKQSLINNESINLHNTMITEHKINYIF